MVVLDFKLWMQDIGIVKVVQRLVIMGRAQGLLERASFKNSKGEE